MDLSLDRVASVTLLKDAASTAIYGAKAANGVVVVETKAPVQGRLRLSYNGSFEVSFADLTDYNLMNAAEKLEFELLAGNFKSNLIASRKPTRYVIITCYITWTGVLTRTGCQNRCGQD